MAEGGDFDPRGKGYLLSQHIAVKGYQAGSLLGLPIAAFSYWRQGPKGFGLDRALQRVGASALGFTAFAGLMGFGLVFGKGLDREGIEDRVYRLHHNEGQNRTDAFSLVGAVAGLPLLTRVPAVTPLRAAGALGVGCAAGVLAHVATFRPGEQGPNRMAEEARSLLTKDT